MAASGQWLIGELPLRYAIGIDVDLVNQSCPVSLRQHFTNPPELRMDRRFTTHKFDPADVLLFGRDLRD